MRILHISTRLILGGSQENTVLSCEGQARTGHDVHLAFGPIFGPEGSMLERIQAFNTRCESGQEKTNMGRHAKPITAHEVQDLVREVNPRQDLRAYYQLRTLIADLKPDIVHTHSSKAGILGRAAAWKELQRAKRRYNPRRPDATSPPTPAIIHTIHGPPFMPIEGNPAQQLKTKINNAVYTFAERFAAKRCHTIVSVADAMTQQFLARNIGKPSQYTTVRSGMELEPYLNPAPGEERNAVRRSLNIAPTDFVIGTVARLAQHKGHDDILDALADDLHAHPNWKLLWVGDGWWKERLLARTQTLNLSNQLILTGLVPPQRIPAMMRAMDVLLHPSYREGLPRTVPQALLAGVPPIAYDADGTREICRTNHTGILVPLANRIKLREAVNTLANNPELRETLAQTGKAECIKTFSAQAMVASLEKVYNAALDQARS